MRRNKTTNNNNISNKYTNTYTQAQTYAPLYPPLIAPTPTPPTDLKCMYKLFFRVDNGLKTIYQATSSYLRAKGAKLTADNDTPRNAINYIQVYTSISHISQYRLYIYIYIYIYIYNIIILL